MTQNEQATSYINSFSGIQRERLITLRKLVTELAPTAEEVFSYGLLGYKLQGKPLVYFGAFAHHIGCYATPNGHDAFKKEFAVYKQGKGSVQFPLTEALPISLIKRVIKFRVEACQQKAG